jgi:hypothetical protein
MSQIDNKSCQSSVFQINAPRQGSAPVGEPPVEHPGRKAACKDCDEWACYTCDNEQTCKDCDEWQCYSCDNENCENNEMVPNCTGVKDYVEPTPCAKCEHVNDCNPVCKDCDEWQCHTCDNEQQPCKDCDEWQCITCDNEKS